MLVLCSYLRKLMVSDKKIHWAFRTRTTPIRESFHFHHLPKLYIGFNGCLVNMFWEETDWGLGHLPQLISWLSYWSKSCRKEDNFAIMKRENGAKFVIAIIACFLSFPYNLDYLANLWALTTFERSKLVYWNLQVFMNRWHLMSVPYFRVIW